MNHGASAIESSRCLPVKIDLLGPSDWWVLEAVRLDALKDSPDAFVADVADETARKPDDWIAIVTRSTWAIARNDDMVVGIACLAQADPTVPEERFVESVWVAPLYRKQGLVRQMLDRLEEPARVGGAERLQLWVLESNALAYKAYVRLGFKPVPDRVQKSEKLRDGEFVKERLMVRRLPRRPT